MEDYMTDEELDRIEALWATSAAPFGEWSVSCGDLIAIDMNDDDPWFIARGGGVGEIGRLELASLAVNSLPSMISTIRDLRTSRLSALSPDNITPEVIEAMASALTDSLGENTGLTLRKSQADRVATAAAHAMLAAMR
jgi:hypothetical protein